MDRLSHYSCGVAWGTHSPLVQAPIPSSESWRNWQSCRSVAANSESSYGTRGLESHYPYPKGESVVTHLPDCSFRRTRNPNESRRRPGEGKTWVATPCHDRNAAEDANRASERPRWSDAVQQSARKTCETRSDTRDMRRKHESLTDRCFDSVRPRAQLGEIALAPSAEACLRFRRCGLR